MATLIPSGLLLLLHLHLLSYPHADEPGYGPHLFDPAARGLRDRARAMQDVCAFLVRALEGAPRARQLLPTYPCAAPADVTAFRTSLARYLEGLRHGALHAAPAPRDVQGKEDGAGKMGWWRDVVVRKSLLEECAGER